nr:hypothetical protein [Gammaproteobacteria bacterium]
MRDYRKLQAFQLADTLALEVYAIMAPPASSSTSDQSRDDWGTRSAMLQTTWSCSRRAHAGPCMASYVH